MSRRPDSTMARRTLRPIRPNPLMNTRTVMSCSFIAARPARGGWRVAGGLAVVALQYRIDHGFGGNSETLVNVLVGRARPEACHADKAAVGADESVPAEAHARLHRDLDGSAADDL